MDIIQSLALIALLSMLIYLIFVNIFTTKAKTVQTSGSLIEFMTPSSSKPTEPDSVNLPRSVASITNKLPAAGPDAAVNPHTAIFSPNTEGILAMNQDIYEKQADFGSDVTNIKQFYKNNPEVFSKILGQKAVTNVADWEQQSKELFATAQATNSGPIQAANFESGLLSGSVL
jgi:hypothetical protein